MDGDGSGFSFSSASDFTKGQDSSDISWGDIFLDGIHSDDPNSSDAGVGSIDVGNLSSSGQASTQPVQSQNTVIGGQVQIPAHLQSSLAANNAVQQANTSFSGSVAYLAPSASTHQHVSTAGRIQTIMGTASQHQVAAASATQQQTNTKLVQIAPSFPMASIQNGVPLQTLLQSSQALSGQTIYGSQGTGLFPAQGSVHIENPKVVNVNFGPHVIGSDGSGQQAIFQTAEGKRVLITNPQLQHMSQSINLTQPLVGTQLINPGGGNVIRASMAQGTIVPSSSTATRQIVLPTGQTIIPRQAGAQQTALPKNVVLRQLNPNMSPVIYQSGQGGQLLHSQPALIASSGPGLQVVNTGGSQGSQVQLIAQPTISQTNMGQQQLNQNTIMNLINNQNVIPNAGNQIAGLVPGQNIFVNGQMLNIGQLGGLTVPQLQVHPNSQTGVTLANLNTSVTRAQQFQTTSQQLVIQQNGQQQQIMLKNTPSSSIMTNTASAQRLNSGIQANKIARTPTPNANSASSTPVPTPTPSTPTPTPTPDLMSDLCGPGGKGSINILEQALEMSDIDLQSFEDDFNFLDNPADCLSSVTTPPPAVTPVQPMKPKPQPTKSKSKSNKSKSKTAQPIVNVTINNSPQSFQQPTAQLQNTHGQKVTLSPQQKIIAANGQVYVLSANGQQLILQPSVTSASSVASQVKPVVATQASAVITTSRTDTLMQNTKVQIKGQTAVQGLSSLNPAAVSNLNTGFQNIPVSLQQQNVQVATKSQVDNKILIKTNDNSVAAVQMTSKIVTPSNIVFTTSANITAISVTKASLSQTSTSLNQAQVLQIKNSKITTLGGSYIKQEPQASGIKQEPLSDLQTTSSVSQIGLPSVSPQTSVSVTTSIPMATAPLVISTTSFSSVPTTITTQSHQTTIMTTVQMAGTTPTPISSTGLQPQLSLTSSSDSVLPSPIAGQVQTASSSSVVSCVTSATTSTTTSSSKNAKEKDPNNIKSMTPIKIANSTLMLSLTPIQKERLEDHLSRMSLKDQNEFLLHQQNIIRRSQQVQQEQQQKFQQQQQQKQQQLQQQQQMQQQLQQQQLQQLQQSKQPQQQVIQIQKQTVITKSTLQTLTVSGTEGVSVSPQTGSSGPGLPITVQELMNKGDEKKAQPNFTFLPAAQPEEQQQVPSQQQQQLPTLQQQQRPQVATQQFVYPQVGRCLAEQQLLRDRSLALGPDSHAPFKSFSDAMRRLVRYHTLQDHKPEENTKAIRTWDARNAKLCDFLMKKKRCYMRRFNKMRLYHDMCQEKRPEYVQNLICFNEQLRELIDMEKEDAKNNPDDFEPLHPSQFSSSPTHEQLLSPVPTKALLLDSDIPDNGIVEDFKPLADLKLDKCADIKEEFIESQAQVEKSESPCPSPSGLKRKLPDKGSTGTLKLVFKRRTTDNFVVKNSLGSESKVPHDLKPVVNLEKSDSEYEYDSNVGNNQPVIVRRRTSSMSVPSRQTSFDGSNESYSSNSHSDKTKEQYSEDEEEENGNEEEEEEEEEDDDEEERKTSSEEDEAETPSKACQSSKNRYHVSFGEDMEEVDMNSREEDCNADAFIETDEQTTESEGPLQYKATDKNNSGGSVFKYSDVSRVSSADNVFKYSDISISDVDSGSTRKRSSRQLCHNNSVMSTISDDVFNSNSSFPQPEASSNNDLSDSEDNYNISKRLNRGQFSFDTVATDAPSTFHQSSITSSPTQEEFVADSPVSNIEKEAAKQGLPNTSLFTTPSKSLLQTDAMFNSSEDEDEIGDGRRMVSNFEIDNKDPQSNMINDSVRSAINSVLNDDDNDADSQASWSSSVQRPPSTSSVHHGLFLSSSSPLTTTHDADLDAAVQSILNG